MNANDNQFEERPREKEEEQPGRIVILARRALRWAVVVLGIFALGILATWIAQVQPKVEEIEMLRADLESANSRIDELEGELEELRGVEAENADLRADLDESELHLTLLSILVDVSAAQLALKDGNVEAAQASLSETGDKLAALKAGVESDQREAVESMVERLTLVLEEIEEDAFAAESDLEVLRNSILALERDLFEG